MISIVGMRTVKWWVRYIPGKRPGLGQLIVRVYRTKARAEKAQRAGEVIFQVKGHYFPLTVKKAKRRRLQHNEGQSHG